MENKPRAPDKVLTVPLELAVWGNDDGSFSCTARIPGDKIRFRVSRKPKTTLAEHSNSAAPLDVKLEGIDYA